MGDKPTDMKALVVTDLHSQKDILAPLKATVDQLKPDAVFCLGDLTVEGPDAAPYTQAFLDACGHPKRPVLCVSGNNDDPAGNALLREAGCLLDQRERLVGDRKVVGLGYAPLTTPYIPDLRGAILLTHIPPRQGTVPAGLTNIPDYHFSGHIHSLARSWKLGKTTVMQVPTAMDHRAALFSLPEGEVEFITLR
jgi:Icc-related predicted phosphoesterase